MPDEQTLTPQPQVTLTRHDNFESWYSNNIQFKPTEWDLKAIFGEMEPQTDGGVTVQQHTAIVLTWLQAKIMHYFLGVQLGIYELTHGKIPIPQSVMPTEVAPPSGNLDTPDTRQLYEYMKKFREQFIESLKTS
jgi:hypothetical protein